MPVGTENSIIKGCGTHHIAVQTRDWAASMRLFQDVLGMKLVAISGRGSRKDFIDLYSILRGGLTLERVFEWLPRKYAQGRINTYHILKSLTYFEDAEREPMPTMLEPFDWGECKAFFVREAHAIVLP